MSSIISQVNVEKAVKYVKQHGEEVEIVRLKHFLGA